MRIAIVSFFLSWALLSPCSARADIPPANKIDHVLLWGRTIDGVTAIMTDKLGFQVKPGHDTGGVANRYIRFRDQGFIELLARTSPHPDFDPGEQADQALLKGGPGARSIGINALDLDRDRTQLQAKGLGVTPVFSAPVADPDGAGPIPAPAPNWRLFALAPSPLSSALFYIHYQAPATEPAAVADDAVARTHPNGARALSAFWLLSAKADADRQALARLGFTDARPVVIPEINAHGYCVVVGPDAIVALEPDAYGFAADALTSDGPQVLGVSIAVDDLGRAESIVAHGYDRGLTPYDGLLGRSFLAPTRDDLGLLVEFHAVSSPTDGPCGKPPEA